MKKIGSLLLTVGIIVCIWHNSLQDAAQSEQASMAVLWLFKKILAFMDTSLAVRVTDHVIRKAAHVTEFALLGCSLAFTALLLVRSLKKRIFFTLLLGLCIACADEYLQTFSIGRACQASDVVIDFIGVWIGCVVSVFIKPRWK